MEVGGAAQATHLRIFDGEMHFSQSRHDRCPGAHGAGFLGHDEPAFVEPPVSRIWRPSLWRSFPREAPILLPARCLVESGCNHFFASCDDGSNRNLVVIPRVDCLVVCQLHEKQVSFFQLRRKTLGKGHSAFFFMVIGIIPISPLMKGLT